MVFHFWFHCPLMGEDCINGIPNSLPRMGKHIILYMESHPPPPYACFELVAVFLFGGFKGRPQPKTGDLSHGKPTSFVGHLRRRIASWAPPRRTRKGACPAGSPEDVFFVFFFGGRGSEGCRPRPFFRSKVLEGWDLLNFDAVCLMLGICLTLGPLRGTWKQQMRVPKFVGTKVMSVSRPSVSLVHFAKGCWDFNFLRTNGFSELNHKLNF